MSFSCGQIWLVTSGACTPSLTSERTVIAMSRLRRHRIGSSWEYSILAICCSGTATPFFEMMVRSPTWARSSRSDGTARAITPTFSMPSRIVVTCTPEISMASDCETPCAVRPRARERHGERLRNVLRRQAERAGAVLVDDELQVRRLLVPVELGLGDVRILLHDVANLVGDLAHLLGVGSDDAELNREADRRTEIKAVNPNACLRQRAIGDRFFDLGLDALARLDALGHDDDLGKGFVRKLRVEAEPEARRALSDIGGVGADVLVVLQ